MMASRRGFGTCWSWTNSRRSTWNSVICSSLSSYTLVPSLVSSDSRRVTGGSERGRIVNTQNAETPTVSTPSPSTTPTDTRSHLATRPFGQRPAFARERRAIALLLYKDDRALPVSYDERVSPRRPRRRREDDAHHADDDADGSLEGLEVARSARR